MKNLLFIILAVISLFNVCAAITYPTPTEHKKVDWTTKIYNADDIKSIVELIPTGGTEDKTQYKYPMFLIPLNTACPLYTSNGDDTMHFNGYVHTDFSEFAIKSSTNNFLNGQQSADNNKRMVYWSSSTTNLLNSRQEPIETLKKYACDAVGLNAHQEGIRDVRAYSFYEEADSDLTNSTPLYVTVIIDYSALTNKFADKEIWANAANKDLIWSYIRFRKNENGSLMKECIDGNEVWNPIFPVRWFKEDELPDWYLQTNKVINISNN